MTYHAKVIAGGKIVIPAQLRRDLGISEGDTLVLEPEGEGRVVLKTYRQVVREVQEQFRGLVPEGVSMVDALIAERSRDAALEEEESRQFRERSGKSR